MKNIFKIENQQKKLNLLHKNQKIRKKIKNKKS